MDIELNRLNSQNVINTFRSLDQIKNRVINKITLDDLFERYRKHQLKNFYGCKDEEMVEWGVKNFEKWEDELTDNETWAIRTYTYEDSTMINSILRGQIEFPGSPYERYGTTISNALLKTNIPEDTILYRTTSRSMLGKYKSLPIELLPGKIINDKAFMSTSLIPKQCYMGSVLSIIKAPKGTSGAYIGNFSLHKNEREVLLNKAQNMIIEEVYKLETYKYEMALVCRILD